jgi:CDP-diacylglycerol---glycerol-3-phosphate 3-phosphatidyltransferase
VKLPNVLTLSRMLLAPLFLLAFLYRQDDGAPHPAAAWWALGLAVFFELTDMVDGAVARHLEQTSQLGKILDPLADSVSRFTIFLGFLVVEPSYASVWAIACIFYRDSIVSTVRVLAASQGVIVSARLSGKVKAVVQGTAIVALLAARALHERLGWTPEEVAAHARGVMWFVAAVTFLSLFDYLLGNRRVLARLDR